MEDVESCLMPAIRAGQLTPPQERHKTALCCSCPQGMAAPPVSGLWAAADGTECMHADNRMRTNPKEAPFTCSQLRENAFHVQGCAARSFHTPAALYLSLLQGDLASHIPQTLCCQRKPLVAHLDWTTSCPFTPKHGSAPWPQTPLCFQVTYNLLSVLNSQTTAATFRARCYAMALALAQRAR